MIVQATQGAGRKQLAIVSTAPLREGLSVPLCVSAAPAQTFVGLLRH